MLIRISVLILVVFSFFCLTESPLQAKVNSQMKVHFIDVQQGDSILIETPEKKVILIDAGPPDAGKTVTKYIKNQQIKKIDLLVATHPDIDHIGGIATVIDTIKVGQIIDSGKSHPTKTYRKYKEKVKKKNIPTTIVKRGDKIAIDSLLDVQILNSFEYGKNNNQSSIVLKINYQEKTFLFMGDIEKNQEESILKKERVNADFIKIAHHGSKTSSSLKFLKEVNPEVAVISYGKTNDFGHPVKRVINNLNRVEAHIYSTAVFGNTIIVTDGEEYLVFPERNPLENLILGVI